jgi:hypothetical protein
MQELDFLVGYWETRGMVHAHDSSAAQKIKGTDSYEWALNGRFLIHRADVLIGNEKVEVIEMIGGGSDDGPIPMRSFDNQGNFMVMEGRMENTGTLIITGKNMRSRLTLENDASRMSAQWERFDEKNQWVPWMDMWFTKRMEK